MKNQLVITFTLGFLICISSCSSPLPPDGKRTQDEFASFVGSFPYQASAQRSAEIAVSYSKVKNGMSKEEVQKVMGEPDYSQEAYHMGWISTKYDGSTWTYCIYCTGKFAGVVGEDRYVGIYFGMDGRVKDIWSHVKGKDER